MQRKYDAVIFDLFGTLVDNPEAPGDRLNAYSRALRDTASILGAPADEFARLWRGYNQDADDGGLPFN